MRPKVSNLLCFVVTTGDQHESVAIATFLQSISLFFVHSSMLDIDDLYQHWNTIKFVT